MHQAPFINIKQTIHIFKKNSVHEEHACKYAVHEHGKINIVMRTNALMM